MGQEVLSVQRLTHGYQDRTLFKGCNFEMEKSERVALIGNSAAVLCCCTVPEPVFLMQPIPFLTGSPVSLMPKLQTSCSKGLQALAPNSATSISLAHGDITSCHALLHKICLVTVLPTCLPLDI